jgi:hypothetical protein
MSETGAAGDRNRGESERPSRRRFALHGVVVPYESRPDRCTIYPRGRRPEERIATWFSANAEAFVGLEAMR